MTTYDKLTADTVTDQQLRKLRDNAGEAGDLEQVALCNAALDGDAKSRQACADAINNARAMEGT
ncbi:MAG TPA: hypothetical protein VFT22_07470 [Kofleriaceae bacterium]|nr:hypothetical protein [Kofleriaceae bacterium]